LWQIYNITQRMIGYEDGIKLTGIEMNWRYGVLCFCASLFIAGFAADPARAQTRVGEAAVVKNEVVRVMGSGSSQINVGDAVLRPGGLDQSDIVPRRGRRVGRNLATLATRGRL
jgi:hypothetical protein